MSTPDKRNLSTVDYPLIDGRTLRVMYDTQGPCRLCGEPVGSASMGGTDVCPPCDMGVYRDGSRRSSWPDIDPVPSDPLDLDNLPDGFEIIEATPE